MKYLVSGWNTFHFLITPEELRTIFKDYHMVIFTAHVPLDYTESCLEEYAGAYGKLYELLTGGERIIWERDYPLFFNWGITSDLSNCTYGKVHTYEGKKYKSADFGEPVVGTSPFALYIQIGEEDRKLHCSTAYSYLSNPENYMGIQLQYPKLIQYKCGEEYEPPKPAKSLKAYQDFEALKNSVTKITRPLTIAYAGSKKRLNIRVSDEARLKLNGCLSFMQKGITVTA